MPSKIISTKVVTLYVYLKYFPHCSYAHATNRI